MTRKPYDPLAFVPSPEAVRKKLAETTALADRLRLLLNLAEQIHVTAVSYHTPTTSPVTPTSCVNTDAR